jgi:formylglycine-generating enzyme required for sulfatase activity
MTGSTSGAVESDAAPSCMISVSNYDQSCNVDSDCVGVTPGNYCGSNPTCNCGGFTDAINASALGQFNADLAKTPSGPQVTCPCPMSVEPPGTISIVCCKNSTCGVCTTVLAPVCTPMAVRCVDNGVDTCAPNGQWQQAVESCGLGTTCVNGACVAVDAGVESDVDSGSTETSPSCAPGGEGMTTCPVGTGGDSCCDSLEVIGGTFYRAYNLVYNDAGVEVLEPPEDGGATDLADPATVSDFRLDKYDVTVARFRQFVMASANGWVPSAGSGKHTHLNGGNGLANSGPGGGYEMGWDSDWDAYLPTTSSGWSMNLTGSNCSVDPVPNGAPTWTANPGSYESLPINCVDWWESYAFCIWDGGFLPSEAEWEYAASGGDQEREYPWGSTPPAMSEEYAIYGCDYPNGLGICNGVQSIAPVGYASLGAGRWGQLDLNGNVYQWTLDWLSVPFAGSCTDCAFLAPTEPEFRMLVGSSFASPGLASVPNGGNTPSHRNNDIGLRCARSP